METFISNSGVLTPNTAMGVEVKNLQIDTSTTTDVTLSGSLGNYYGPFNGISPIDADMRFGVDEIITVASTVASGVVNSVIINYVYYTNNSTYMIEDPSRNVNKGLLPGKWDVN